MNGLRMAAVATVVAGSVFVATAVEPVAQRERDSADRNQILRWYDWGDKGKAGEFVRCEGRLDYDIEVPKTGWYALEQQGAPAEWDRTVYLDGRPVRQRLKSGPKEGVRDARANQWWLKDLNLFIEKGRRTLSYERTGFPGVFPIRWRLLPTDGTARGTIRVDLAKDVVRTTDDLELTVTCGTDRPMRYELVAVGRSNDETNLLTVVETSAVQKPTVRTSGNLRLLEFSAK